MKRLTRYANVVRTVSAPGAFQALLHHLGILDHWDEIGDLDVTVRVLGAVFDRQGYPVGSVPPYPEVEELTVCFYKKDVYLGGILLADLCRLAASAPDEGSADLGHPVPERMAAS